MNRFIFKKIILTSLVVIGTAVRQNQAELVRALLQLGASPTLVIHPYEHFELIKNGDNALK